MLLQMNLKEQNTKMVSPGGTNGKDPACQCRRHKRCDGFNRIPGSGRSPGGGHGNPLQYSCLENPMDREAWQDTVIELQRVGHDCIGYAHIFMLWGTLIATKPRT